MDEYRIIPVPAKPLVVHAGPASNPPEDDWEVHCILKGTGVRVFAPCGCNYTYLVDTATDQIDLNCCTLMSTVCNRANNQKARCWQHVGGNERGWDVARQKAADFLKEASQNG